jgi:hypothetical protein
MLRILYSLFSCATPIYQKTAKTQPVVYFLNQILFLALFKSFSSFFSSITFNKKKKTSFRWLFLFNDK